MGELQAMCTAYSTVSQGEIVWMSAGHCVTTEEAPSVVLMDGYKIGGVPAQVIVANIPKDIAMFKGGKSTPRLELADKKVKQGDSVYVLGFPLFFSELIFTPGTIAHIGFQATNWPGGRMILNLASANGNSGAPVLNQRGELVGMITGGFCRISNPFGVPIEYQGFCSMSAGIPQDTLIKFITERK